MQLIYYLLMLVAIYYGTLRLGTTPTFGGVLPVTLAGNYLLYWIFSRGLPTTSAPMPASKEYVREQIRQGNRAFGKPLIVVILSVLMAVAGLWAGTRAQAWGTAGADVGFFGLCAAVFAWQLRNQKAGIIFRCRLPSACSWRTLQV